MDGQTWKERGVGTLKLNHPRDYEKSPRLGKFLIKNIFYSKFD